MAKRLKFYDVKRMESFTTSKYSIRRRYVRGKLRRFAVATRSGVEAWRVLPKD